MKKVIYLGIFIFIILFLVGCNNNIKMTWVAEDDYSIIIYKNGDCKLNYQGKEANEDMKKAFHTSNISCNIEFNDTKDNLLSLCDINGNNCVYGVFDNNVDSFYFNYRLWSKK